MDEIVEALRAEQDRIAAMVEPLDRNGLATPSRCQGWSVADVLLHLAQTNELAVASLMGSFGEAVRSGPRVDGSTSVDDWVDGVVAAERTDDLESLRDRWLTSAEIQATAFAQADPAARVEWVAGEMAARTLATTRFTEHWIHAGDIAAGLGVEHPPGEHLHHIVRLTQRTLPYAFTSAGKELTGPVRFELHAPSGEQWSVGDEGAPTVIRGAALDLVEVAGQRRSAAGTTLTGEGPDARDVLALVRTFA
jgi:uncharacterized protein (TIGR03084 family)